MPAMRQTALLGCLFLLFSVGACRKREAAQPPTPPSALARAPIPPPPPPSPGLSSDEVKQLLTEDKLGRLLTYEKEMAAATAAASRDEPAAKVEATSQAALAKSGLTQVEVTKLGRLVTPYYARIAGLQEAMRRLEAARLRVEEAKSAGREPSLADLAMEKALGDQSKRLETVRREFGTRYGEDRLALLEKHEADLLPVHLQVMSATQGGMAMHRPPLPLPPSPAPPPPAAPPAPAR